MVNDEELNEPVEWSDPTVYAQSIEPVAEHAYSVEEAGPPEASDSMPTLTQGTKTKAQLKSMESQLWFEQIPELGPEDQIALDAIADEYEAQRLLRKKVLVPSKGQDHTAGQVTGTPPRHLSTTFVRTWRSKMRDGRQMFLRRSRLCAREY